MSPFHSLTFMVAQARPWQLTGKCCEFVIMRGKQRPAPIDVVQMFEHRPGNRQAVKRCRAAADFIQDDQ